MNRPYAYRGKEVSGVYQRCTTRCGTERCERHRWQYEVEVANKTTGKRQRVTKGGFATGKEALTARAEVIRAHRLGTLSTDMKMTVGEWLPQWLAARIERGELRDGTAADYRDSITRYLVPRLGHLKVADLRPAHITAAYDAMRRDRAEAIKAAQETNVAPSGRG